MTPQEFINKRKQLLRRRNLPILLNELIKKHKGEHSEWLDANGNVINSRIYNSVGLSRNIFSKMLSNADYHPEKYNVCKIAIALQLNLEETQELLSVCGYAFSSSIKFDIIVQAFIQASDFRVNRLDSELFREGQKTFVGIK